MTGVAFSSMFGGVEGIPPVHRAADRELLIGKPSAMYWLSAITLYPGSSGMRKGGGRLAADDCRGLMDQLVILESLNHE